MTNDERVTKAYETARDAGYINGKNAAEMWEQGDLPTCTLNVLIERGGPAGLIAQMCEQVDLDVTALDTAQREQIIAEFSNGFADGVREVFPCSTSSNPSS